MAKQINSGSCRHHCLFYAWVCFFFSFGQKGTKSVRLPTWSLSLYRNSMELLRLGCRVLLSFSNSHITTPQHTADSRQYPQPSSINPIFASLPCVSCPILRQSSVASPMATLLKRQSTIWWLTPVFLPKMRPPKSIPESRWFSEEGATRRSSSLQPALQASTKRPRFLPCQRAMEHMFLKRAGACLRVTSRKRRVITRVWTKRTLLPYSRPLRRPLSSAKSQDWR